MGCAEEGHVCTDLYARPELHLSSNEHKGTDNHVRSQDRSVFDTGCGVDLGQVLSPFR